MRTLILSLILIGSSPTFAGSMVFCGSEDYPSSSLSVPVSRAQDNVNRQLKSTRGGLELSQLEVKVDEGFFWNSVSICVSANENASVTDSVVVCGSDYYASTSREEPSPMVQLDLNKQLRSLGDGYQISDRKTTLVKGSTWSSFSICVLANKK